MMPEDQGQQLSVQQFAARLRDRFPGAYDDLPDQVLVEHTIAHYPQYKDMLAPQRQPQAPSAEMPVTGFEGMDTTPARSKWVPPSQVIPPEATRQGTQGAIAAIGQPPLPAENTVSVQPPPGILDKLGSVVVGSSRSGETPIGRALGWRFSGPAQPEQPPTDLPMLRPEALHETPGPIHGALQFAGGLTTPENAAIMAATSGLGLVGGPAASAVGRLISLGFSYEMLKGAVQQYPELKQALQNGDLATASEIATKMGLGAGMAVLGVKHAAGESGPLGVVTPEQGAEIARQPMPENTGMPAYLQKIVAQRQAELLPGPGAKTAGPSEMQGSPLAQLTAWLPNLVSPKQTPIDRIKATTAKVQDLYGVAGDDLKSSILRAETSIVGLWDSYRRVPEYTDFRKAVSDWQGGEQYAAWEVGKFADKLKEQMPDPVRREALTNWMLAEGDEQLLRDRAATASPKLKPGYEAALKLNEEEKTFGRNIRQDLDAMLELGQQAQLLEQGRANYVTQLWQDNPKMAQRMAAVGGASELQTKPFLTKHRVFADMFEGEDQGFTPKSKDIGYLLSVYHSSFAKAIADRGFIKQLLNAKASDGRNLVAVSGVGRTLSESEVGEGVRAHLVIPHEKAAPADYQSIDSAALRRWKWVGKDEAGKPIYMEGDMLVHPEAFRHLKNVLGESAIRKNPVGRAALRLSSEFKSTLLSIAGFHQVTVAMHGLEHRVNPLNIPDLDLTHPLQHDLVNHGLMVASFNAEEAFGEGLQGSGLVAKIPGIGTALHAYTSYLFRSYIPRLKMEMAKHAFARNMSRYEGKLSRDQILELTATQANAAFGEQNLKMLGRNKTLQDTLRLILLAPDFLESRAKFVGQALTKHGAEQRQALALGAAVIYTAARIFNQMMNGNPEWDPAMAFSFRVGKRVFSWKSVQAEALHLATEPRQFAEGRMNPLTTRTLVEAVTGRDRLGRPRDAAGQLKDLALAGIPIPLQGVTKPGDYAPGESALKAVGVSGRRYQTRAERTARDAVYKGVVFGESTKSPEEQKLIQKHRTSIEAGKFDANAVRQDLKAGRLTERDAKGLLKESTTTRLLRDFRRLSLEKALDTWDVATADERKALRPALAKKASQLQNRVPAEREPLRDRLRSALKETGGFQEPIPALFRKFTGGK